MTLELWELVEISDGQLVDVRGILTKTHTITTKRGETMMFARLEDRFGAVVVVLMPRIYDRVSHIVADGAYLRIRGRVDQEDRDSTKLVALDVAPYNDEPPVDWVTS